MNVRREGMGSPSPITERPGHRAGLELADGPAKDDTEGITESGLQSFELSQGVEPCRDSSTFQTA